MGDPRNGQLHWSLVKLEDESGKTTTVHCIDGFYFHQRQLPFPFGEHMKKVRNMEIRSDDVMIFSYPKSGTHWVCNIVSKIQRVGSQETLPEELNQPEYLPFCKLNNIPSPRYLSSHARSQFAPHKLFTQAGKIIFLERNPKAVAISFYHMLTKIHVGENGDYHHYNGSWDDFLEMFLNGNVPWGSWFDYVIEWRKFLDKLHKSKYLLVTYEELSQDPVSTIEDIATFLGRSISRSRAMSIAEECSFSSMKKSEESPVDGTMFGLEEKRTLYYRAGKVDDWKNWFTVAQEERFDDLHKQKFGNCAILEKL